MSARETRLYDLAIIGGGVNGCGIARDAAGRGYSVLLAEAGDLASATSSGSTKLIHGGLRYLENLELRLVRESLAEREVLLRAAPHIVRPLRFVLPHSVTQRPAWMLRLGLFLYDHIGGRERLPGTRTLDLSADPAGRPLRPGFKTGFEYSDCWVDDARLVVLNARDAADRGADIFTRTRVTAARRQDGHWRVALSDAQSGATREVAARMLVNAAGPWVDIVRAQVVGHRDGLGLRLVQGSHLVVRKLYDHDRCYILQNPDGRIFFAIPYEGAFTLIGTTDRDITGDPGAAVVSDAEIDYLLASAATYLERAPTRADVVWTYTAVRPLHDGGAGRAQAASRDYALQVEGAAGEAKLLNVIGGKITTYRRLAEAALAKVDAALGRSTRAWTAAAALPGGDFKPEAFDAEAARLAADYPFLEAGTVHRIHAAYGTTARTWLGEARRLEDLGRSFGAGLTEREVDHLQRCEWAVSADDVLWRRTKLGLRFSPGEREALAEWLNTRADTS